MRVSGTPCLALLNFLTDELILSKVQRQFLHTELATAVMIILIKWKDASGPQMDLWSLEMLKLKTFSRKNKESKGNGQRTEKDI